MSKPEKKFRRAGHYDQKVDAIGLVKVKIYLVDPSKTNNTMVKTSIIRSLSVKQAKVSDVFAAIESALFEEG